MKKNNHKSPMEYRIRYKVSGAVTESVQHYMVYHSSEALDFLFHTFKTGHIHSNSIYLVAVEEYDRFKYDWDNRTEKALEYTNAPFVLEGDTWRLKKESCIEQEKA